MNKKPRRKKAVGHVYVPPPMHRLVSVRSYSGEVLIDIRVTGKPTIPSGQVKETCDVFTGLVMKGLISDGSGISFKDLALGFTTEVPPETKKEKGKNA